MILLLVTPSLLLLALLALASPPASLLLLVALLPTYLIRFSVFSLPTNFLEAAIVLVFLAFSVQPALRRQWTKAWRRLPLPFILGVSLFVTAAVISTVASSHLATSFGILKSWIFAPLLLGWVVFAALVSYPPLLKIPSLLQSLIISGNAVALLGLLQFNHLPRIRSIYDVPNSLALYLVPLLVLSVWLFFCRRQRLFYLPSALILGAALIATQSVAGLAAAILTVSIGILFFRPLPLASRSSLSIFLWLIVLIFVLVAAGYLASTGRLVYLSQPLSNPDIYNSLSVRRQLWSVSLDLIQTHPWKGVGLGDFEPAYQESLHARFRQFEQCQLTSPACSQPLPEFVFRDPHNWLLSFWLNTGLLGLASFIFINAYVLIRALVFLKKPFAVHTIATSPRLPSPCLTIYQTQALMLSLISILIFGLADTIYWKNDLAAQYWVILGLLAAHPLRQPDHSL